MRKLIVLTFILCSTGVAFGQKRCSLGNEGCYGGDVFAQDMDTIALAIVTVMSQPENAHYLVPLKLFPENFRSHYEKLRVFSFEHVYVEIPGIGLGEVDCKNHFPIDFSLELSRFYWRQYDLWQRVRLTFHEMTSLDGLEKGDFKITNQARWFIDKVVQYLNNHGESQYTENIYGYCAESMPPKSVQECQPNEPMAQRVAACAEQNAKRICQARSIQCAWLETTGETNVSGLGFVNCVGQSVWRVRSQ